MHQKISTGLTRVYKSVFGRGPTRTTLHLTGDVVLCVFEEAATPGQERLTALGRADIVHAAQIELQRAMVPEMTAIVEAATGREVRACVCGFDAEVGAATNTFLLVPEPAASRRHAAACGDGERPAPAAPRAVPPALPEEPPAQRALATPTPPAAGAPDLEPA